MCIYLQFEIKWPQETGLYLMREGPDCLPRLVWYLEEADAIFSLPDNNRRLTGKRFKKHEATRGMDAMLPAAPAPASPYEFACLAIEKPVVDFCIEDPAGEELCQHSQEKE